MDLVQSKVVKTVGGILTRISKTKLTQSNIQFYWFTFPHNKENLLNDNKAFSYKVYHVLIIGPLFITVMVLFIASLKV